METDSALNKGIVKEFIWLVMSVLLCRLTFGVWAFVIAIWGCCAALKNNVGRALSCNLMLVLFTLLNPFIFPYKGIIFALSVRGGALLIGLCMIINGAQRNSSNKLPMGFMWVYLLVCCFSSMGGWYPEISYMKLLQFAVFFLALVQGAQQIYHDQRNIFTLRASFVAMSIFVVIGSLLLWPFPQWSSLGAVITFRNSLGDMVSVEELVAGEMNLGNSLLCGVLFQSQALAVVVGCIMVWSMCDMLFVEKRIEPIRASLIFAAVFVLFLTKSRTGLLSAIVGVALALFYALPKVRLSEVVRSRIKTMIVVGVVILSIAAIISECRNNSMSTWVRKRDDVSGDDRSMVDAVTMSRMGLIEKSLRDYDLNPILGMGFQVEERHRYQIKGYSGSGLILSASIEKGILPLMILGETGIIGSIVFCLFILVFYITCHARGYYATIVLFSSFIASNMGEATFFSPGGPGGIEWMISLVGGFLIDLALKDFRFRFAEGRHLVDNYGRF